MEEPASLPPSTSSDDSTLANSSFLTRQELLKRRARLLRRLAKSYKKAYWLLMEELRLRVREYYWKYGCPFKEDENDAENNDHNGKLGLGLRFNVCGVPECGSKAMALSNCCFIHILSDPKQILYKVCKYTYKIAPTGSITCKNPLLRMAYPSLCPMHVQKLEKNMIKDLRKGGLPGNSSTKLASKFHVVVSQYIRLIQTKRRAALTLRKNNGNLP